MSDPVRLLEGGAELTADERRALRADSGQSSPLGAKQAVWGALGVKLVALGAAAEAAAATGTGATSAAKATVLSLVKAAGVGVALGTAVGTASFFVVPRELARPPRVVAVAPSAIGVPPAPRARDAPERPVVPAPSSSEAAPRTNDASRSPSANGAFEAERAPEATPFVESESQRVARARTLLRSGDARRALEELRALEQDEPRGLLVQEREALLIEALSALGQRYAARERAAAFLKRYPSSPHARAVRRAAE